ncbi:hypothetical protein J2W97_001195 [Paenibacillus jamilae]|nr:hypothetical protein [Paenibacillus jamilae]
MDKNEMKNLMKELLKEEMVIRVSDASDMYNDGRKTLRISIEFEGLEIDSDFIDV